MSAQPDTTMERTADFSPCRTYRYRLTRRWSDGPMLNVIGLNPSTADETQDDPTIRRCIGFARDWGYHGLVMTNLLGYRATDPKTLDAVDDPTGPDNWDWLVRCAQDAGFVLAAWGAHPAGVWASSHAMLRLPWSLPLYCLGKTKDGHPRHPLYIAKATQPIPYRVNTEVAS